MIPPASLVRIIVGLQLQVLILQIACPPQFGISIWRVCVFLHTLSRTLVTLKQSNHFLGITTGKPFSLCPRASDDTGAKLQSVISALWQEAKGLAW